jgi:hypothetical protein
MKVQRTVPDTITVRELENLEKGGLNGVSGTIPGYPGTLVLEKKRSQGTIADGNCHKEHDAGKVYG